ncbi:MAG: hypothetical protein HQL51_16610, partial [Magnetococcales bacterium]|nr:hypothetical protein [Magnetococcales bacterium]
MSQKRNIAQELLDGVRAIKAGQGKRVVVELPPRSPHASPPESHPTPAPSP